MFECQFCGQPRKSARSLSQHRPCCPSNPNRKVSPGFSGKTPWNIGLTKETDPEVQAYAQKMSEMYAAGKIKLSGCALSSTEERSARAKAQGFGGYRENAGRSQKFRVEDSFGDEVVLQSSYELRTSIILNELGIKWVRPKHLKYNGRKYFPDFYLPDLDIYLDPKNDFKAIQDREKINAVIEQNSVIVHILSNDQINKSDIHALLAQR